MANRSAVFQLPQLHKHRSVCETNGLIPLHSEINRQRVKLILNISLAILIILIVANALFWLMAVGSGHNIPGRTTNSFIVAFLVLGFLIATILLLKGGIVKQHKQN